MPPGACLYKGEYPTPSPFLPPDPGQRVCIYRTKRKRGKMRKKKEERKKKRKIVIKV
jgi:hypothetical protein